MKFREAGYLPRSHAGRGRAGLSPLSSSSPRSLAAGSVLRGPLPMASWPSLPTRLSWALGVGGVGGETSLRGASLGRKPHPLCARADPASEVEKPHTNQGQLGPPSASAPSPRLPSQTEESQRAVGLGGEGVVLREEVSGSPACVKSPPAVPHGGRD